MKTPIVLFTYLLCSVYGAVAQDDIITFDFRNITTIQDEVSFGDSHEHALTGSLQVQIIGTSPDKRIAINFLDAGNTQFESLTDSDLETIRDGSTGNVSLLINGSTVNRFPSKQLKSPFRIVVSYDNTREKISSTLFNFKDKSGVNNGNNGVVSSSKSFYENTLNVAEPFKDAVSINSYVEMGTKDRIVDIMKDYFPTGQKPDTWAALMMKVKGEGNLKLLEEILKNVQESTTPFTGGGKGASVSEGSSTSILTNPTILIDALAQLIAKRFKEELSIAYLEKMKEELGSLHLDKLLPQTYATLTFHNVINYKSFIPLLREALHNDYTQAPDNLYSFIHNLHTSGSISDPKLYSAVMSGLYIVKRSGDLPADILEEVVGNVRAASLQEAISDMVGTYVEQQDQLGTVDWVIGDNVPISVRNLQTPAWNCFDDVVGFPFLDRHLRSQPLGHWYFLVSTGAIGGEIVALGTFTPLDILLEALNHIGRDSDYPHLMEATIQVALEQFGRCAPEFIAIASAWEEICVPTGLETDENGLVTCEYMFTLPSTICEEDDYFEVCLDNPISGFHYRWTVIGKNSSQFVMNGSQTGNSTTGLNLSCLELYTFPNYPYYPQKIIIEVYSPNLGSSFVVRRGTLIVDCENDDPTCEEYYEASLNEIQDEDAALGIKSDDVVLGINQDYDNKAENSIERIELFNVLGSLVFSGTIDEFDEFMLYHKYGNSQILFKATYFYQNSLVRVEKMFLKER